MTITADAPLTTTDWTALVHDVGSALAPGVAARDRIGEIATEGFRRLRDTGITAALVPAELGGGGVTHSAMGELLRGLGRFDGPTAVALSMHTHLVAAQVWRHLHGQDASGVLRKVGQDRAVLISTGASDWVGSNGSARRVEGGYRVSARKSPASGCEVGQVLVTSIRHEPEDDSAPQVIHCAVPFTAEGVSIEPTWDTLGMRATGSHTVVLDDVFVPDAAVSLVRPADQWHPVWNTVVGAAIPLIMSAYLGIADAAVEEARRVVAGRQDPHVVTGVGEMLGAHLTAVDAVAGMYADADDLRFANTDDLAARTLARKSVATEAVVQTVRLAVEVAGGFAYTRSSILERLYRDVHGCLFHPLPRAKQLQFTGRVALGLSPVAMSVSTG